MPIGGLIRWIDSRRAVLPASLGPIRMVLPWSTSNQPLSRMERYLVTRTFFRNISSREYDFDDWEGRFLRVVNKSVNKFFRKRKAESGKRKAESGKRRTEKGGRGAIESC